MLGKVCGERAKKMCGIPVGRVVVSGGGRSGGKMSKEGCRRQKH